MCGIVGLFSKSLDKLPILHKMVTTLQHRGPDDTGFYVDQQIGLGQARLSIMDIEHGKQPVCNEDESIWVVFNGEIFNFRELRTWLVERGHKLTNLSDSAIIPHLYEELGVDLFKKLNGQFAIGIWDRRHGKLILGRDRMGEKPLFFYHKMEVFSFASEIKALLKNNYITPKISSSALQQIFTFWSIINHESIFEDIFSVPAGYYLVFEHNQIQLHPYWKLSYSDVAQSNPETEEEYIDELERRIVDSVKKRMLADVPVGAFLSGGLDSSLIASIAVKHSEYPLSTYSITFGDEVYDESSFQERMAQELNTNHQSVHFTPKQIPEMIRQIVCHVETPFLRPGVFPMYYLAKLVRENNQKVVLSGEGADELFGGYDIFKEEKIRLFCAKKPDSQIRKLLFKKVNNFVSGLNQQPINGLSLYYTSTEEDQFFRSHILRWKLGSYSQQFFSEKVKGDLECSDRLRYIKTGIPSDFQQWTYLQKAQYLEIHTFLKAYLLSSQGDRVSMASSIEVRYPFLDPDVIEFARTLPDILKLKVLQEKYILKRLAQKYLPREIVFRKKFPYRAPLNLKDILKNQEIQDIISFSKIKEFNLFNPSVSQKFFQNIMQKEYISEREIMVAMGIITTQVLFEELVCQKNL